MVVDAGPGYMTRRMEAADGMIQIINMSPNLAEMLVPKIARNLDWPDADKLADELDQLKAAQAENAQLQQKLQMVTFQLDSQKKQADTEETQAKTEKIKTEAAKNIVNQ